MAEDKKTQNKEEADDLLFMQQREAVNNAYAKLEGQALAESFSAFTIEEAMGLQIERIDGKSTETRPNLIESTTAIRDNLIQAVTQIKEIPPERFIPAQEDQEVNTPND